MRSRHLDDSHDHEAQKGCPQRARVPVLRDVNRNLSLCVFSLRSKRRIEIARLKAAHFGMRTSDKIQSVLFQFLVS